MTDETDSKTDFGSIAVAICVAAYIAIMLAYLAQYDLGLTAAVFPIIGLGIVLAGRMLARPVAMPAE